MAAATCDHLYLAPLLYAKEKLLAVGMSETPAWCWYCLRRCQDTSATFPSAQPPQARLCLTQGGHLQLPAPLNTSMRFPQAVTDNLVVTPAQRNRNASASSTSASV
eukprot:53247-Amphidinium_carterae.1